MNHSGAALGDFFRHSVDRGEPLVLATIVHTQGSTYRKAGAQMLIAGDGRAAGLLSGGCLEADLMEHARRVIETGAALRVEYDTRSADDLIWGIGLGCEGAMSILLTKLDRENGYEPFSFIEACRCDDRAASVAIIIESSDPARPVGAAFWAGREVGAPIEVADALRRSAAASPSLACVITAARFKALLFPVEPPPRVLILGAGPDATPLVEIAGLMNWHVVVLDHRPAYAIPARFPRARRVAVNPAAALDAELEAARYDAAVVMSHHLVSDRQYLAALARSTVPYIGLLGPAPRRARLLSELGPHGEPLGTRLFGPIGLDIGARTPETIALAIVSEIQAVLAGRDGESFRVKA